MLCSPDCLAPVHNGKKVICESVWLNINHKTKTPLHLVKSLVISFC